jgi:diguanylate cyclase (GGDEF)-like protein
MILDGTTLLVVALIFTGFAFLVWILSAFLFKSSPAISSNFALTNFFLGNFMLFYVLRGTYSNMPIYITSDISVILGCSMLRRATQEFAEKGKTDTELVLMVVISFLVDIYARYNNLKVLAIVSICLTSLYFITHAAINAYQYMVKNFKRLYSIVTVSPLFLMAFLVVIRVVVTVFAPSQVNQADLRVDSTINTGFLIIMLLSIIGFNSTALGLVISRMITRIKKLSQEDPLTNTFNRRYINEVAEEEIDKVRKNNTPLSVVLLDIDHFKKVNDVYGHAAGDAALIACVNVIKANIRSTDYLARLGGEEFCILLPNTDTDNAQTLAERIRANIEAQPVLWEDKVISITASFGITSFQSSIKNEWSNLLNKADIAMYQAKNNGRNQVVSN